MAVIPSMMVLYTDDAVEVRYTDGSRLQLSACGASMFHVDPPSDISHPRADSQGVQKWTQFVTSTHRNKVIQALDFRNRFAQRPFLCSALIPPEDIVSLHAQIDKVLWPKTPKDADIEIFEDGSRRTASLDEYASIVLSPHGQDYTVCYLCHISEDVATGKSQGHTGHASSDEISVNSGVRSVIGECFPVGGSQSFVENHNGCGGQERKGRDPGCSTAKHGGGSGDTATTLYSAQQRNDATTNGSKDSAAAVPTCEEELTLEASGLILSEGTVSTPGRTTQHCDLHTSAASLMHHDISSISRVSTPDGLRGMVDCDETEGSSESKPDPFSAQFLHSSPVNQTNAPSAANLGYVLSTREMHRGHKENDEADVTLECTIPGVRSLTPHEIQKVHSSGEGVTSKNNSRGSLDSNGDGNPSQRKKPASSPKADKSCQTPPNNAGETDRVRQSDKQVPFCEQPPQLPVDRAHPGQTGTNQVRQCSAPGQDRDQVSERGDMLRIRQRKADTWSAVRHYYTWVTQHISHSECNTAWRHPLKLLQQTDSSHCGLNFNTSVSSIASKGFHMLSASEAENSVSSPLAPPLPLTCRFQHQHAWQPQHQDVDHEGSGPESAGEFKHGRFKVIMMEGVIYRFIEVAKLKVVEIYPGDGSVFVSQGLTGHFFSHIMWRHGKLEEKTYSVGTFPANSPKLPYSAEKLVKRGHRFLTGCLQSSRLSQEMELPCWKQKPLQVVEPLSVSILEECRVMGYGRFTAYTNGRIRILFDDRTALDTLSDFSHRLEGCLKHSNYSEPVPAEKVAAVTKTGSDWQLGSQQCQLLLPSGRYVTVELQAPGLFRKYTEAAKEWIKWVQSSPKERRQFYHQHPDPGVTNMSAEAELKKIERFNYIVDHTGSSSSETSHASHNHSGDLHQAPNLHPALPGTYGHAPYSSQHSLGLPSAPPTSYSPSGQSRPTFTQAVPVYPLSLASNPKDLELMEGFNHAREALLRTSQMIKDIDDIVKERKKTL